MNTATCAKVMELLAPRLPKTDYVPIAAIVVRKVETLEGRDAEEIAEAVMDSWKRGRE
jgi:hypothetical protein